MDGKALELYLGDLGLIYSLFLLCFEIFGIFGIFGSFTSLDKSSTF